MSDYRRPLRATPPEPGRSGSGAALLIIPLLLAASALAGCGEWRVSEYYGGGTFRVTGDLDGALEALVGEAEVPGISEQQLIDGVDLCEASDRGGAYLHWPLSPDNVVWSISACVPLGDDLQAAMNGGEDLGFLHLTVVNAWVKAELSEGVGGYERDTCWYEGYNDFLIPVSGDSLDQIISEAGTAPQDLMGLHCGDEDIPRVEGGTLTVDWAFDPEVKHKTREWDELDLNFE